MTATLESPEKLSAVEAVNILLSAYGEALVTALGETADAVKAEKALIRSMTQAQAEGYTVTTIEAKTLEREADNTITVGPDISQVVPSGASRELDAVVMNGKLFDRGAGVYTFDADVEANVTYLLSWDHLPQPVAWYITYRAAISFVSGEKSGDPALRELQEQLRQAKIILEQYDSRLRQGTLLEGNPHFHRTRKRRRRSL